jgi:hypothetical protein
VLGLGDIGAAAAIPVMDGKAMLFKEFAGVDAFPLCIDTNDVDEIVGPRGSARPLSRRVGRRAHERVHAGGRRGSGSRPRPPSGRGDARAPLSIATAFSPRTAKTTGGPIEGERQGCGTRRHWGWAAKGPKPGPGVVGQDRALTGDATDREV